MTLQPVGSEAEMRLPRGVSVVTALSLCSLLLLTSNTGSYAKKLQDDDSASAESVARATCASRCLNVYSTRMATLSTHGQNNGYLGWCQTSRQCAKCLEPCKDTWGARSGGRCRDLCESVFPKRPWECETSCEYFRTLLAVKQGDCPPTDRVSGFAAACVESCEADGECASQKKCCPNGCGHTCQSPRNLYKGVPLKPRRDLGLEELSAGSLEVRWSSRFNVSAEPVVYLLQSRWNYGIQPSEDTSTPWQVVAQTTNLAAALQDVRPGRWYQFRVAAVNVHGTRGFTTPSRHIQSTREPSGPLAPSGLAVANMTFGPGRAVRVRVQWRALADRDVPVHYYKVSWSWPTRSEPHGLRAVRRRKRVRATWVDLDSMRSNRSYSVEVQAVFFWGHRQLKSPKTVLRFTTQPGARPTHGPPAPDDLLGVGTPFYQDSQLQVRIYWKSSTDPSVRQYHVQWGPEYCLHNRTGPRGELLTQERLATLHGLLFSCKYTVLLHPISSKARPPAESASFFTPSCVTIQAKSQKPIVCSGVEAPAPREVLAKTGNLTASFDVRGGNVTAVFSWELSSPHAKTRLIGYHVTWAEVTSPDRRDNNNNIRPHSLISQSQILLPEQKLLEVSGLRLSSLYRLDVRVVTAEGEGLTTSRLFQTPSSERAPHRRRSRPVELQPIIKRH